MEPEQNETFSHAADQRHSERKHTHTQTHTNTRRPTRTHPYTHKLQPQFYFPHQEFVSCRYYSLLPRVDFMKMLHVTFRKQELNGVQDLGSNEDIIYSHVHSETAS